MQIVRPLHNLLNPPFPFRLGALAITSILVVLCLTTWHLALRRAFCRLRRLPPPLPSQPDRLSGFELAAIIVLFLILGYCLLPG